VALPVLEQFAPQLTLLSAGVDIHERDPLASMRVTTAGYASLVAMLSSAARRHGGLAFATEGGYDLQALEECLNASLHAAETADISKAAAGPAPRGERTVAAVRAAQAGFWKL
jgi:acetoin utilization deacetylase AcuC-like enzyme